MASSGLIGVVTSPRTAWLLVVVLAGGFAAVAGHFVDLSGKSPDYVAAAEKFADSDRSQTPRMRLEAQYPGPLQDTTIQRWRDPVDGTVCYIYLPIAVAHAAGPNGLVQYGAANIGSISCFPHRP